MQTIDSIDQLQELYGEPSPASLVKEIDHLIPEYRRLIEASPFVALATAGPEGLDCSPRGDPGMVVTIHDDRTLMIPDRKGNNRVDSLRNIVRDGRVALLFLIPGSNTTLRANGRAVLSIEPDLLDKFAMKGKPPRSIIVFTIETIYFQCARALMRSNLWSPEIQVTKDDIPSAGDMLAATSNNEVGGEGYDDEWLARANDSMW